MPVMQRQPEFTEETMKILIPTVIIIVILLVVGTSALMLVHRFRIRGEAQVHPAPGALIDVGTAKIHLYQEGQGELTFVFLSGHGTGAPVLDFKPLWRRLSDIGRIVVVERPGYGWSSGTIQERTLDNLLTEIREALQHSGINGKYVLVPHSFSGLIALHWVHSYPGEVEAIIALDPSTPATVHLLPQVSFVQDMMMRLTAQTGLARYLGAEDRAHYFPLIDSDDLTAEEQKAYLAISLRNTWTAPMRRELDHLHTNAEMIAQQHGALHIPMLCFISEKQEQVVPGWKDAITGDLRSNDILQFIQVPTGHYLHHEQAETIATNIRKFMKLTVQTVP